MNRDSAKGNLSQAAANRIETRMSKKTQDRLISKYGSANHPKVVEFNNKTKDFQKEANDFNSQKEKEKTARTKSQNPNLRAGAGSEGGGGTRGGRDKIVCTMMNESYGFGSFRNKIWLRHSKNLAPEYQIGYHRIFLPLVKKAKTNKVLKKILEHIAIHRTIDIRQEERNKIHLLGRVYRTILEPICYWVGKI
jgi:hypothetical protein